MTIKKDFFLSPSWDEATADSMDRFCQDVVAEQVEQRAGTYTGTGGANTVQFARTLGTPSILWLENTENGTVTTIMSPRSGGNVTAWAKDSFTLEPSSGFNTAGKTYRFLLFSS